MSKVTLRLSYTEIELLIEALESLAPVDDTDISDDERVKIEESQDLYVKLINSIKD